MKTLRKAGGSETKEEEIGPSSVLNPLKAMYEKCVEHRNEVLNTSVCFAKWKTTDRTVRWGHTECCLDLSGMSAMN